MKILKRNQIIISVLALMLITVGYMSYTSNMQNAIETGKLMDAEKFAGIGDARLVSSSNTVKNNGASEPENNIAIIDNNENSELSADSNIELEKTESASSVTDNSVTSNTGKEANYFAVSRLERDTMYSQMVESYQNLISNNAVSPEQKNISTQEISKINNQRNSIMIAENLIKNLGFQDVVIFVNDMSTSVIVKADKLEDADVAKIHNVVCREIGVETENIHISLK